ncbi:MAG: DNA internalization-related competence protein ComEC/Rec2 [Candidatus Binatus sp.]|uniref:DNA internalization-related competence protein ComEC/Rec2 n=1 Tax=Candidatus Binatus sp. TaxID=2811406 RepID=UPI00271A5828|nr:DNA internalization-related competence protein ComEC/Rec2 [Candidatus Binatus sp.]MDO8433165.1 DNA internalization-related competence protein ComEC/Rec2 [Candidatus Binatus sp.]
MPLWPAIVLALIALMLLFASRPMIGLAIAYLAIFFCAASSVTRLFDPPRPPQSIRNFADGSHLTIEGRLYREPERETYGVRLYAAVNRAGERIEALRASSGTIRIAVLGGGNFNLGDEILLTGRIRFPRNEGNPGEFDYAGLMARDGIDATMSAQIDALGTATFQVIGHRARFPSAQIEDVRKHIGEFIDRNLSYPENAEMRALVIGDRGEIQEPLRQTFARTGMAHLLVISGLHLSIVGAAMFAAIRLAMMLLRGLSSRGYANKVAAIAAAIAVCAYASIAGHHVSTIRALVMVLAYMLALAIDRPREAIASLALAAIVICVALPGSTADIGFQLSFASVIAIVIGMRRFAAWFTRRKRLGLLPAERTPRFWRYAELILGYCAVSFWAMLGTAPLTAFHFNQFAIVGLVANAVVVPIMAFGATVSGLVAAAISFVSEPLARIILHMGGKALELGNWFAAWFVDWPLAWFRTFTPTPPELGVAYGLLILWLLAPLAAPIRENRDAEPSPESATVPARRFGWRLGCVAVLLLVLLIDSAWWLRERYFNPDLRVTFLSVGEGDAAAIQFPGARVMLIDGGGSYSGFDAGERIVAPFLWSRKIMRVDYLVLSHPDLDHFGGLDFIALNFAPRAFWTTPITGAASASFVELLADLIRAQIPLVQVGGRAPISSIAGVAIDSLNNAVIMETSPSKRGRKNATHNNASMVLRFSFGPTSILFTGDIEAGAERAMLNNSAVLRSTMLKVPHHGSATSSTPAFIAAVHPQAAIISDGYLNRFHFPSATVLDRYAAAGARVFRTDLDGALMLDATRDAATIRTWRDKIAHRVAAPPSPSIHH